MKTIKTTRVFPLTEVTTPTDCEETLCFQEAVYNYPDQKADVRFRFIRRDKNGNLKPQRGQAGIDDLDQALNLILEMAEQKGMKFKAELIWKFQSMIDTTFRVASSN